VSISVAGRPTASAQAEIDESVYRLLVENSTDVLVLAGVDLKRLYVSPACIEVMGYSQQDMVGRTPANLLHPDDADRVMAVFSGLSPQTPTATTGWRMLLPNGKYRWMETTYRRLPDGRIISAVRDIQQRKEIEEQLAKALDRVERLAMHDSLTDLANRRCFLDTVDRHLKAASGTQRWAILIIDLDRFKPVNDIHGHATGDHVLVEMARRLRSVAGTSALLARLGGDEFAVLLDGKNPERVGQMAHAIIESVSTPLTIGRVVIELGASVGIAVSPQDGMDTGTLLRCADVAMYHAKRAGRAAYHFFDRSMDGASLEQAELQMELRDAIAAGEIVPYYHPLINLRQGTMVGLEALARWEHPIRGTLQPSAFITLVENMGLADALFQAMLASVCRDALAWPEEIWISVNLSPVQLADAGLPRRVAQTLSEANFDPKRLVLEVTESLPVTDSRTARQVLAEFRACGIAIALDDFGTGHSSLSLLHAFNFDKIKIDRSFVSGHVADANTTRYLKAIIGLGQALNLEITAEGIETAEAMEVLRDLGCAVGQGYLYGKPVPAADVDALVRRYGTVASIGGSLLSCGVHYKAATVASSPFMGRNPG
jgi:diguanylate cyclase (GGDEF)-like protein/PAS domain S-box-containing protein